MKRTIALIVLLATSAQAQVTPADEATAAATRLAEAEAALQTADEATNPVAALSATVKAFDDGLIAARRNLEAAETELEHNTSTIGDPHAGAETLIATLMTASLRATPALHPGGPTESLRATMIRSDAATSLRAQADKLGHSVRDLHLAKQRYAQALQTLQDGVAGAQAARQALQSAMSARAPLPRRFEEDPVQTALISANVASFEQATTLLSTLYPAALPNDAVLVAKGQIPSPVTGRVLASFGTETAEGQMRTGTTLATPPAALVVSPTAATILYQGPMLAFETVVILEPSAGVTFILAGMSELFGHPGQIITAGTPLGIMGGE